MCFSAISRGLRALSEGVVTQHMGDAQAIVFEDLGAPFRLSLTMLFQSALALYGLFVAPE